MELELTTAQGCSMVCSCVCTPVPVPCPTVKERIMGYACARAISSVELVMAGTANCMLLQAGPEAGRAGGRGGEGEEPRVWAGGAADTADVAALPAPARCCEIR